MSKEEKPKARKGILGFGKEKKEKVEKKAKVEKMIQPDYVYTAFQIDETVYRTLTTKKFDRRKVWHKPNPDQLFSFIPGNIEKILVKPGDEILEGESMLILEAMKMKNNVLCPRDAIVKLVAVTEGQNVPKGVLMIELEPLEFIEVED